eukprot:363857-Chlamydomonas_euryale.AAC.9
MAFLGADWHAYEPARCVAISISSSRKTLTALTGMRLCPCSIQPHPLPPLDQQGSVQYSAGPLQPLAAHLPRQQTLPGRMLSRSGLGHGHGSRPASMHDGATGLATSCMGIMYGHHVWDPQLPTQACTSTNRWPASQPFVQGP